MNWGCKSLRPKGLSSRRRLCPPTVTQCPRPFSSTVESHPSTSASASTTPRQWWDIASAVVISRAPILTRDLPEFEQSYYFYQRRLNDRLQQPFARWFYFKPGTTADQEWKRKRAEEKDKYNPYGPRGWADELHVGDQRHCDDPVRDYDHLVETTVTGEEETMAIVQARLEGAREAEARGGEAVEGPTEIVERPFPRTSRADEVNDTRRLDRKMSRTLYLVVRREREAHDWRFPQSNVGSFENLRRAALRTLADAAGTNMNTWFVGSVPIGFYKYRYPQGYQAVATTTPTASSNSVGKKVFFMKARILAGQADLKNNKLGLDDFQWLTKDEMEGVVEKGYFKAVRHMLVAQ